MLSIVGTNTINNEVNVPLTEGLCVFFYNRIFMYLDNL